MHHCLRMGGYLAAAVVGLNTLWHAVHPLSKAALLQQECQRDAETCKVSMLCHADIAYPQAACAVLLPSQFSDKKPTILLFKRITFWWSCMM